MTNYPYAVISNLGRVIGNWPDLAAADRVARMHSGATVQHDPSCPCDGCMTDRKIGGAL